MDCDNQEIEATKTIGSTDIEKVLKNLKNKHTKESIILLDYIEKLEKENKELENRFLELIINGKPFKIKNDVKKLQYIDFKDNEFTLEVLEKWN